MPLGVPIFKVCTVMRFGVPIFKVSTVMRFGVQIFGLNNILFQFVETFAFKYIDRIQRHNHTGFENKHIMHAPLNHLLQ